MLVFVREIRLHYYTNGGSYGRDSFSKDQLDYWELPTLW